MHAVSRRNTDQSDAQEQVRNITVGTGKILNDPKIIIFVIFMLQIWKKKIHASILFFAKNF